MKHAVRFLILVTLLIVTFACAPPVAPVNPEELMEVDRGFARATAERGAEGWTSYFAENGRMMPDAKTEVKGRDQILAAMKPLLSDPNFSLTWEPDGAEVSRDGDMGYTWGHYTSRRVLPDGVETSSRGRYLTVWRRQADGTWKVEFDLGNSE